MTKNKNGFLVVVIIIVLILVGWYLYMKVYPTRSNVSPQGVSSQPAVKGQVLIDRNSFIPETMTVKVGETVTWVNEETYGHSIKSDSGIFESPKLATGDKYSYTFTKEGTYTYICSIHPFMHGTIVVSK